MDKDDDDDQLDEFGLDEGIELGSTTTTSSRTGKGDSVAVAI